MQKYIYMKNGLGTNREIGSISTIEKYSGSFVYFRNRGSVVTGITNFFNLHKPLKEGLNILLQENNFEAIFIAFEQIGVEDLNLQKSNYNAIKKHERAGGDFQSVQNSLAKLRVWVQEIINKLPNE